VPPDTFGIADALGWSRWVVENGLPELPVSELAVGKSFPVAYWVGPTTAAVLHIQWIPPDEDDDGMSDADVDVDLFLLIDGRWENSGGGGAGPYEPLSVPSSHVGLTGMNAGTYNDRGCKALWGQVGTDAAVAEVDQAGQTTGRALDAPVGLAVVSGEYFQPMTVRVLDAAGNVLALLDEPAGDGH
jgi:hypothetical protein